MSLNKTSLIACVFVAGILNGCAAVAPGVLVQARDAYNTSSAGLAAKLTPTELYDAKKVLDKANREFGAHGDTLLVRDYSYIATRKIELADVKARTEIDRQKIAEAIKQGVAVRDSQVKSARTALANTRQELKDERNANDIATSEFQATNNIQGQRLENTTAQLDSEKQARMSAEAKLAGAMKDLAAIAAVKEEARGLVITLSGSVLFASGQYSLLETAKNKLDQVAEALKAQTDDKNMVVEGHTDSQGSDATNQPLSEHRAAAVREYLVSRGVDADKISSIGLGSSRPLLDNRNAENRANNRRVEIVIKPTQVSAL